MPQNLFDDHIASGDRISAPQPELSDICLREVPLNYALR